MVLKYVASETASAKVKALSLFGQERDDALETIRNALRIHLSLGMSRLYKVPIEAVKTEREKSQKRLSFSYLDGEMTEDIFGLKGDHVISKKTAAESIGKAENRFKIESEDNSETESGLV